MLESGSEWLKMRRDEQGHTTRHKKGQGEIGWLDSQSKAAWREGGAEESWQQQQQYQYQ